MRYLVKKEIRRAWDEDEVRRDERYKCIVKQEICKALDRDEACRDRKIEQIFLQEIRRAWDEDEVRRDERLKYIVKQEIRKASDAQRIMCKDNGELRTLIKEQTATTDGFSVKARWIHGHDSSEWWVTRDS